MGEHVDGVGVGGEHDLVFGDGVGETRDAFLGIQPERSLRDRPQQLALDVMQERGAR